jgi:hypothetical protein
LRPRNLISFRIGSPFGSLRQGFHEGNTTIFELSLGFEATIINPT